MNGAVPNTRVEIVQMVEIEVTMVLLKRGCTFWKQTIIMDCARYSLVLSTMAFIFG
jgi:hypothetical protein